MNKWLTASWLLLIITLCGAQVNPLNQNNASQNKWVDSVFNSLSAEERLAQLFMVAAYSNRDMKHTREIKELITKQKIGGLIWMQGSPTKQGKLANYYQSLCKTPLLYSIDGEWGLAMRLDSTIRYPRQMTLGAIQNDSLIYQMGRQIARECKRIGLHVNFAPVADVNNNPLNPVIGMRSFGEEKFKVAHKAYMYMKGLQDEQVLANGKHFPGHGDTDSDSHLTMPLIKHDRPRLDSLELFPFNYLFERGLGSIMVAHLNIPHLDTTKNRPSTLSPKVVSDLLKRDMGYKGLIFTDALNMKGVANYYKPGDMELKALQAGNDVLLFSADVPKAMAVIKNALDSGLIKQEEIDERCKKVLASKYWCGLYKKQEVITRKLTKELNGPEGAALNEKLASAAITLLKNENGFLPLQRSDSLRITEISFGLDEPNTLFSVLSEYGYTEHAGLAHNAKADEVALAFEKITGADVVVMQLNKTGMKPDNNYGLSEQSIRLMDSVARLKPTILVMMSNPYVMNKLGPVLSKCKALILSYEYMPSLLKASAHVILGIQSPTGKLPVSAGPFKYGAGLTFPASPALKPLISTEEFQKKKFGVIDSLALSGIAQKAYPGCQVVALHKGQIIYQKSFGNYTYNRNSKPVDNGTVYDLASLTKIASTALSLMKLATENKFDYHKTLGDYLPELEGTNKKNLAIEEVLAHQAGLQAWIPFYQSTLEKNGRYKSGFYDNRRSENFPLQVAKNLFAVKGMNDSVYKKVNASKLEKHGKYLYSDLGYYYMQKIIEQQSQKTQDAFVADIYAKMGLGLMYKPLNYISRLQIAPTENDNKFRKQLVQGYVHDPGAALLGGVSGHAGLFGNALDVARLMQMFMNKGELNGLRILDSNVVKEFTACRFCPKNRRGLCFEKPEPDTKKESPVTSECSLQSFGHSGFTGTFAWADPANEFVLVFLSNRVYPDAEENRLTKLGIRGKIHKAFYEAIKNN